MAPGPRALASPKNSLEMQILHLSLTPAESETETQRFEFQLALWAMLVSLKSLKRMVPRDSPVSEIRKWKISPKFETLSLYSSMKLSYFKMKTVLKY